MNSTEHYRMRDASAARVPQPDVQLVPSDVQWGTFPTSACSGPQTTGVKYVSEFKRFQLETHSTHATYDVTPLQGLGQNLTSKLISKAKCKRHMLSRIKTKSASYQFRVGFVI